MVQKSDHGYQRQFAVSFVLIVLLSLLCSGCFEGYSSEPLYPADVTSVYVKMFDNQSFRRDLEYTLTDALAKRIESQTPYKIISSEDRADSVISGRIESISEAVLTGERKSGRALEKEVSVNAIISWKNLKTGELFLDNVKVSAWANYSQFQGQSFEYGSQLAANNLAVEIVERMQNDW